MKKFKTKEIVALVIIGILIVATIIVGGFFIIKNVNSANEKLKNTGPSTSASSVELPSTVDETQKEGEEVVVDKSDKTSDSETSGDKTHDNSNGNFGDKSDNGTEAVVPSNNSVVDSGGTSNNQSANNQNANANNNSGSNTNTNVNNNSGSNANTNANNNTGENSNQNVGNTNNNPNNNNSTSGSNNNGQSGQGDNGNQGSVDIIVPETNATHSSKKVLKVNGVDCYVGDTITVRVNMKTPKVLENFQGYTKYDDSYLQFVSVEGNVNGLFNDYESCIYYNGSDIGAGFDFTEKGTLYTATFKVLKEGNTGVVNTIEVLSDQKSQVVNPTDCIITIDVFN